MNNSHVFCIDASCFISLDKQTEFLKVLDYFKKRNPQSLEVFMPSEIYEAILLSPELKFIKLKKILKDWKETEFDLQFSINEQNKYVQNTRYFLSTYRPKPADEVIGNVTKLGKQSIHKDDVLETFGRIGGIIWDTITISSERRARIISFGEKTTSMVSKIGTQIRKGHSEYKEKIRSKSKIVNQLRFWIMVMVYEENVPEFIREFQIDVPFVPLTQLPVGLIIIADGF